MKASDLDTGIHAVQALVGLIPELEDAARRGLDRLHVGEASKLLTQAAGMMEQIQRDAGPFTRGSIDPVVTRMLEGVRRLGSFASPYDASRDVQREGLALRVRVRAAELATHLASWPQNEVLSEASVGKNGFKLGAALRDMRRNITKHGGLSRDQIEILREELIRAGVEPIVISAVDPRRYDKGRMGVLQAAMGGVPEDTPGASGDETPRVSSGADVLKPGRVSKSPPVSRTSAASPNRAGSRLGGDSLLGP